MINLATFLRDHWTHAAPILFAGAFAVAIIVERTRALFIAYPMKGQAKLFDQVRELVFANRIADAIALCERYDTKPAAQVVKEALLRAHQPIELVEQGLEIAVAETIHPVQQRTGFLATIANVATLLGLLGTIAGLIQSFEGVGAADAQQKATLLAAGISTAMNATMLGLGIAIPCMVAFSVLANRSNRIVAEIDQAALKVVDLLKQKKAGHRGAPPERKSA
jgi:biopolymer transport protein ExbB